MSRSIHRSIKEKLKLKAVVLYNLTEILTCYLTLLIFQSVDLTLCLKRPSQQNFHI